MNKPKNAGKMQQEFREGEKFLDRSLKMQHTDSIVAFREADQELERKLVEQSKNNLFSEYGKAEQLLAKKSELTEKGTLSKGSRQSLGFFAHQHKGEETSDMVNRAQIRLTS